VNEIDLTTMQGCQNELQACSRGLAYMDHWWGALLDAKDEAESVWAAQELEAAALARADAPSGATATEIKALITKHVNATPSARKALDEVTEKRRQKEKLERWFRSLEKRQSAAQAARNGHEALAKYGGGG
jgi:hypothetical protein